MGKTFNRDAAPTTLGGDLWNDGKLAREVFRAFPDCQSFRIEARLSGLYVQVRLDNGQYHTVFDTGRTRAERMAEWPENQYSLDRARAREAAFRQRRLNSTR